MIDKLVYNGEELFFCPGINVFLGKDDGFDRISLMDSVRSETGSDYIVYQAENHIEVYLGFVEKTLNDPAWPGNQDVILWFKPEEGLHPSKIKTVVDFLVKTARNGKQVFITTNDYLIIGYLENFSNSCPILPEDLRVPVAFLPDNDMSVVDAFFRLQAETDELERELWKKSEEKKQ